MTWPICITHTTSSSYRNSINNCGPGFGPPMTRSISPFSRAVVTSNPKPIIRSLTRRRGPDAMTLEITWGSSVEAMTDSRSLIVGSKRLSTSRRAICAMISVIG